MLATPGARLLAAAGLPAPAGVKEARRALRGAGLLEDAGAPVPKAAPPRRRRFRRASAGPGTALRLRGVWAEVAGGRSVLRGIDLDVGPHERIALMGRNGAGKSTLLRHAAALEDPTRGRVTAADRVALLLQHPGDYLLHERVGDEVSPETLRAAGLSALAERHPRDLSGGERQRLAMAIVTGDGPPPAVLCLDEPTRGLDRAQKAELAHCLRAGAPAIIVATHDPEFAAQVADRVILLADGAIVADAPAAEVLSGGWYFATETARILGGAGGALLPEEGAAHLAARSRASRRSGEEVSVR
jgi:energy-coupling factor transport system ATP-binding protein